MRRALVFGLIGLLLLAGAASAGPERRPTTPGGPHNDRAGGPPTPIGAFVLEPATNNVAGDHVSFNWSANGIEDYATRGQTLFDLRVEAFEDENTKKDRSPRVQSEGAVFRVRNHNFTFTAHDNPGAVGKLETDGRVLLTFEEGVVITIDGDERARFSYADVRGSVRGDDLRLSGRTLVADDGILVFVDEPRGSFDKHRGDIGTAIARGHVGAEATLNALDTDRVAEEMVSYGNVTMTTVKAEKGNITILVDGHGIEGRVLVLNVDGRVLGAESADKLEIRLDNLSIAKASNLTDILDPEDDGYSPEYYLVYDPGAQAFQVIVTVPHYSVHTLSVTTAFVLPPPSVTIGILAGVALLVPAAIVLFRKR